MKKIINYIVILLLFFIYQSCVRSYTPPSSSGNLNALVVGGSIAIGSATTINLSRTNNISDTAGLLPEKDAQVSIQSESGTTFTLVQGENGKYTIDNGPVDFTDKYSIKIHTADGHDYSSDFVEAKQTPPIDSVEWVDETEDIKFYVNTHDASNNSKYYRWQFEETSEHHAFFDSHLEFRDGALVFLTPDESKFACFDYFNSKEILLNSTSALSNDVVSHMLINTVHNDFMKISVRYSLLVKQYVLTPEAYKYWQILKSNSEQTGNIFDPQPAKLYGNIHCISNPQEPVLGYISASSVTEKRIFIRIGELKYQPPGNDIYLCKEIFISPQNAPNYLSTGEYAPAYLTTRGELAIVAPRCVDCRLKGGITEVPSYW
jgi:hypothetical protein